VISLTKETNPKAPLPKMAIIRNEVHEIDCEYIDIRREDSFSFILRRYSSSSCCNLGLFATPGLLEGLDAVEVPVVLLGICVGVGTDTMEGCSVVVINGESPGVITFGVD